ncbi:hypothetical protein NMY22_g3943 [Coprinellus aureogranulatus]|nr:hypothetical protein NMY22_g3943 [Coprinellus aureogranulatus]
MAPVYTKEPHTGGSATMPARPGIGPRPTSQLDTTPYQHGIRLRLQEPHTGGSATMPAPTWYRTSPHLPARYHALPAWYRGPIAGLVGNRRLTQEDRLPVFLQELLAPLRRRIQDQLLREQRTRHPDDPLSLQDLLKVTTFVLITPIADFEDDLYVHEPRTRRKERPAASPSTTTLLSPPHVPETLCSTEPPSNVAGALMEAVMAFTKIIKVAPNPPFIHKANSILLTRSVKKRRRQERSVSFLPTSVKTDDSSRKEKFDMASHLTQGSNTPLIPFLRLRNRLPPPQDTKHRSTDALRKLIDSTLIRLSPESYKELKIFVVAQQDLELVSTILNAFLVHQIPSSPQTAIRDPSTMIHAQYAIASILDVVTVIRAMLGEPLSPPDRLFNRYLRDILEKWPSIVKWLHLIVDFASFSSTSTDMLSVCADVMVVLSCIPIYEGLAEEHRQVMLALVEMTTTIDFVIRLFTYTCPERGIRFIHFAGKTGCKVISTMANYIAIPGAFDWLVDRILQKRSRYIDILADAIIQRAVNILEIATRNIVERAGKTIPPLGRSLVLLISCATKFAEIAGIRKILLKKDFAYTLSTTFSEMCRMVEEHQTQHQASVSASQMELFWPEAISSLIWITERFLLCCCLNPIKTFPSILKGRFIDTALLVLQHSDSHIQRVGSFNPRRSLGKIISLLTMPGAITPGFDVTHLCLFSRQDRFQITPKIWEFVQRAERISSPRSNRENATICSNLKHVNQNESKSQICSGCQSVAYCSQTCQREDWTALHREECAIARAIYGDGKEFNLWTPLTAWQHYVFYLEDVAQELLGPRLTPMNTTANIAVFDFVSREGLTYKCGYPLQEYSRHCWLGQESLWTRRLAQIGDDEELFPKHDTPATRFLVEGIFPFKAYIHLSVFTKMKRNSDDSFKAVNTIFQFVSKSTPVDLAGKQPQFSFSPKCASQTETMTNPTPTRHTGGLKRARSNQSDDTQNKKIKDDAKLCDICQKPLNTGQTKRHLSCQRDNIVIGGGDERTIYTRQSDSRFHCRLCQFSTWKISEFEEHIAKKHTPRTDERLAPVAENLGECSLEAYPPSSAVTSPDISIDITTAACATTGDGMCSIATTPDLELERESQDFLAQFGMAICRNLLICIQCKAVLDFRKIRRHFTAHHSSLRVPTTMQKDLERLVLPFHKGLIAEPMHPEGPIQRIPYLAEAYAYMRCLACNRCYKGLSNFNQHKCQGTRRGDAILTDCQRYVDNSSSPWFPITKPPPPSFDKRLATPYDIYLKSKQKKTEEALDGSQVEDVRILHQFLVKEGWIPLIKNLPLKRKQLMDFVQITPRDHVLMKLGALIYSFLQRVQNTAPHNNLRRMIGIRPASEHEVNFQRHHNNVSEQTLKKYSRTLVGVLNLIRNTGNADYPFERHQILITSATALIDKLKNKPRTPLSESFELDDETPLQGLVLDDTGEPNDDYDAPDEEPDDISEELPPLEKDLVQLLRHLYTALPTTAKNSHMHSPIMQYILLSSLRPNNAWSSTSSITQKIAGAAFVGRLTFAHLIKNRSDRDGKTLHESFEHYKFYLLERSDGIMPNLYLLHRGLAAISSAEQSSIILSAPSWDADAVTLPEKVLWFHQIGKMVSQLRESIEIRMRKLLFDSEVHLAPIQGLIQDDPRCETPGYSFVEHPGNPWHETPTLARHILETPALFREYGTVDSQRENILWHSGRIAAWLQAAFECQEELMVAVALSYSILGLDTFCALFALIHRLFYSTTLTLFLFLFLANDNYPPFPLTSYLSFQSTGTLPLTRIHVLALLPSIRSARTVSPFLPQLAPRPLPQKYQTQRQLPDTRSTVDQHYGCSGLTEVQEDDLQH